MKACSGKTEKFLKHLLRFNCGHCKIFLYTKNLLISILFWMLQAVYLDLCNGNIC